MTIESVHWVTEQDRASVTDKESSYTQVYRVVFVGDDLPMGTPLDAIGATDGTTTVPSYNDEWGLSGLFVNKIESQRGSDPNVCDVYVTFSSLGVDKTKTGKWEIDISSDGIAYTETVTRYTDNKLICNSTGDLVDPAPPKTRYDEKFTITYKTDALDANALAAARGKINIAGVTMTVKGITRTFAANTLKLVNAPWKVTFTDGAYSVYAVTIEMEYRAETWALKVVDKGLRVRQAGITDPVPASDGVGGFATSPVYLDGTGKKLDTTGGVVDAVFFPATAKFIDDTTDFSAFLSGI